MPDSARTRTGLRAPKGSTDTLDTYDNTVATAFDVLEATMALDGQGTFAVRPPPGKEGLYYLATDTGVLYRDNGTTWDTISRRRRVVDISGAASYTFSGLDGNVERLYRLAFQGYWGGTTDLMMSLILSDATATSSLHRRCYFQSAATHEDVGQTNGTTGIIIAGRYFGGTDVVTGEVLIQAHEQPHKRTVKGSYTSAPDAVANAAVMMGDVSGYWVGGSNMTALTLDFASSFDGRLSLETLS
jgi:hypothetical protein